MCYRRVVGCTRSKPLPVLLSGLLVLAATRSTRAQVEENQQASPVAERLAGIERKIEQLRASGDNELADRYQRQLQAGLESFERSMVVPRPQETQKASIERVLREARDAIDDLRAAGEADKADALLEQLRPIEQTAESGEFLLEEITPSDEPEVHCVELVRGSTLPDEYSTGTDRFKLGYAEVHVEYAARPVILVLSGAEPILWNVNAAKGSRIHAVVLAGKNQQTAGLSGPLTLPIPNASGPSLVEAVQSMTGRSPATRQRGDVYSGDPIVIGPKSDDWVHQYLLPIISEVAEAARHDLRTKQLAAVEDLRFQANYFPPPFQARRFQTPGASRGEFTLAGPIAETLIPMQHESLRHVATVSAQPPLQFALSQQYELVVFEGHEYPSELTKVPLSSDLPGRVRFSAMAYDATRNRLVIAAQGGRPVIRGGQPAIYAYDVATGAMSKLQEPEATIAALAYAADQDVYYAVTSGGNLSASRLLEIAPDGTTTSSQELSGVVATEPGGLGHGAVQLIPVGENLVLIVPTNVRRPGLQEADGVDDQIYFVNRQSGNVLYSGPVQVQRRGASLGVAAPESSITADGPLAAIDRKFAHAEASIARVRERGEAERAATLSGKLESLRRAMQGRFDARRDERLYLVGIHEQHATTVRVTDTAGPITLVVCSYNPATWTIQADDGVDLRRIIVGGYHVQQVKSSPTGVPIEIHCSEQGGGGFHTYGFETDGHQQAVQQLKEYTDLEIAALIGNYGYESEAQTVFVGPENGSWRAQEVNNGLDRVIAEASVDEMAAEVAALSQHRFYAVHFGNMPRQPQPQQRGRRQVPAFVAQFTLKGPLVGRAQPISVDPQESAFDSTKQLFYTRNGDDISWLDLRTGKVGHIAFDNALPRLSWPSGLAFDSKRQRLLVTSFGGGGYLYAYDLATEAWSVLRRPGIAPSSMVYAADQDLIYTLDPDMGEGVIRNIVCYNAHGAFVGATPLKRPIHSGHRGPPNSMNLQLAYVDNHLLLLRYDHNRFRPPVQGRGQPPPKVKASITVLDLGSGEAVYEGELVPYVERKDLTEGELANMWRDLAARQDNELERLLWDMAAGHDASIEFIAQQFRKPLPEPEADVSALIRQLDSDKFVEREEAYGKLVTLGSRIAPQVREAALEHKESTEIQSRLRSLVEGWESAAPPTPEDLRQVRGVEVLARIATPGAKELLEQVADGLGSYSANRGAVIVLEEIAVAGE